MSRSLCFALGARDGDPPAQLRLGLDRVEAGGLHLVRLSSLWETEPVGLPPGGSVFNAAAVARTSLGPLEILSLFQEAEAASGRRRDGEAWRSLDLDLLLLDEARIALPGLEVPHPRFHRRRFNLAPLAEIAPGAIHPVLRLTVADLLAACGDPAWVRPVMSDWAGRTALHRGGPSGKIAAFAGSSDASGAAPTP